MTPDTTEEWFERDVPVEANDSAIDLSLFESFPPETRLDMSFFTDQRVFLGYFVMPPTGSSFYHGLDLWEWSCLHREVANENEGSHLWVSGNRH